MVRRAYAAKVCGHELAAQRASQLAALPAPADVVSAAKEACEAYGGGVHRGGGIPAVAAKIGMKPGVLYNKLQGDETSYHRLHVQDLQLVVIVTGDLRPLQALARTLNCVCIPVPDMTHLSDAALIELLARVSEEGGDYHRALRRALEKGGIDAKELALLTREKFEWVGAIEEAHARVKGLAHD